MGAITFHNDPIKLMIRAAEQAFGPPPLKVSISMEGDFRGRGHIYWRSLANLLKPKTYPTIRTYVDKFPDPTRMDIVVDPAAPYVMVVDTLCAALASAYSGGKEPDDSAKNRIFAHYNSIAHHENLGAHIKV